MDKLLRSCVIACGTTLSTDVLIANARGVALHFPLLTSCSMIIQAAYTGANSADYFPLSNTHSGSQFGPSGGNITLLTGIGSCSMIVTDLVAPFPAFRLLAGVAQAVEKTIQLSVAL